MIKIKLPLKKNFFDSSYIEFESPLKTDSDFITIQPEYLYNIMGLNGVGKSTLLNILSLLTNFNGLYDIQADSILVNQESEINNKDNIRYKKFSYIFQDPHIINMYTVQENLEIVNKEFQFSKDMKTMINDIEKNVNSSKKDYLIKKVTDLIKNKNNSPYSLSGGEKQLLSFIRAMIKPSEVIFADEPWASMDQNLKEFVEKQLYLYLANEDLFSIFRKKPTGKFSNTVMVITHLHQHNNNNVYGIKDEAWTKIIPVTNYDLKAYKQYNHSELTIERYSINK